MELSVYQSKRFKEVCATDSRGLKSLLFSISLCFISLMNYGCSPPKDKPETGTLIPAVESEVTIASVPVGHNSLVGRWLRPDGGYILEIRSASPDGKLDVGYFNPNPIHVAKAEWIEKNGKLYVLAELRDVNYPGSTYGLEYHVAQDKLVGSYYQAVEKNTYDVEFTREK